MADAHLEILTTFADESSEMAEEASRLVVKLEQAAPPQARPLVEQLARTAHNLKGAAASIGLDELSHLAHLIEAVLEPARQEGSPLTRKVADIVLLGLDALAAHARALAKGRAEGERAALRHAWESLEALAKASGQGVSLSHRPAAAEARSTSNGAPPEAPEDSATVRVLSSRLNAVMSGTEELHSLRNRLDCRAAEAQGLVRHLERCLRTSTSRPSPEEVLLKMVREAKQMASALASATKTDAQGAEATAKDLGENIRSLRTVPASGLLDRLNRSVRDHARRVGKEVALAVEGRHVEVDRLLLEELKAPLTHLLRNAVDHGIEELEVRRSRGKPLTGSVTVGIELASDLLRLTVEDDGGGVSLDDVRRKAAERGFMTPDQAAAAPEAAVLDLLFVPGFSTASEVTETSGRGVGLDVVREAVTKLRGTVRVETQPLQGTRFTLETALTVAATHALLVRVDQERFALPTQAVKRIRSFSREEVKVVRSQAYLSDGDHLITLDRLGSVIGMTIAQPLPARFAAVILSVGSRQAAFVVSDYEDEAELMVKPIAPELRGMKHLQGIALLGSGEAVLVLQPDQLVRSASGGTGLPEPAARTGRYTVLVVDDSATTRLLHQSALEAAGFSVIAANDGESALRLLGAGTFDAVVADIRMPKVSGLELCKAIRSNPRLGHLPVLLCTSLEREEDRQQGLACGATAFLPKSEWEQGLLAQVVRSMLKGADG
jgi:chemotaxis protein histidine kinase CheA